MHCKSCSAIIFFDVWIFVFLDFNETKSNYLSKITSRFKTLFIPFLIWNHATLFVLAFAQTLPLTRDFFSGSNNNILDFDFFEYSNSIIGLNRYPISYQFWFIRDLIILAIFSPATYFIIIRIPSLFLSCLAAIWILNTWPLYFPSIDGTLFFCVGAIIAIQRKNLFHLDKYFTQIAAAFFSLY